MADPTKAWNLVFTKGSKKAQDNLKKVHGKNPQFQAFLKSHGMEGGERSVKQASTSLKKTTDAKVTAQKIADLRFKKALQASSERVKEMGRRRREGGEGLGGGLETARDVVAHVKKYGSIKAGRLGEEVELLDEASKRAINITKADLEVIKSADHETVKNHMAKLISRAADTKTNARPLRADKAAEFMNKIHSSTNVGQLQKMAYNMYLGGDDEGKSKYGKLHVYKPQSAMGRSYQRRYGIGEGFDPEPADIAAELVKKHGKGNVTSKHLDAYEGDRDTRKGLDREEIMKHVKKLSEETVNEVSKAEAEKVLGGAVKEKPKMTPGKQPAGYRYVRGLARKAMKAGLKKEEIEVTEAVKDAADVGEYDYEGDMAKSQLRSILVNAKRLHDMLEENTNLPEWVQSKITLAQDYILTAASYMEGEMNEEALAALDAEIAEEVELFEKAPPGSKYERMVKHIKTGYAKGGLTKQEKGIAYATAWKAYNKAKNEEVETEETAEQIEEKYMGFKALKASIAAKGGARDPGAVAAAIGRKKYGKEKFQAMAAAGKKANEEVVTEAEGKVAVSPKEKALAAHHGDKSKITYGDVIKARIKSAAEKAIKGKE